MSMTAGKKLGQPHLMALMWMDRGRRYFISTCSNTVPGSPIVRSRWRPLESGNGAERRVPVVQQPQVVECYYSTCGAIDRYNRCRQDDINIEKKFKVKEWSMRVTSSLLAICVVDA